MMYKNIFKMSRSWYSVRQGGQLRYRDERVLSEVNYRAVPRPELQAVVGSSVLVRNVPRVHRLVSAWVARSSRNLLILVPCLHSGEHRTNPYPGG